MVMSTRSDDSRGAADAGAAEESSLAAAAGRRQPSLLRELCEFAWHNKKWWIIPVVGLLLLLTLFVVFADAGLLPFIYALF